jgi:hypothetical protein
MADPPFPISHLHQGEQDRIETGDLTRDERTKLMRGENPWPTPTLGKLIHDLQQPGDKPNPEKQAEGSVLPKVPEEPKGEYETPHFGFSGSGQTLGEYLVSSLPGRTAQEEYIDELRRFMPEQIRAEYEKADAERAEMLWDANERAFKEAEKRKRQRLLAEKELTSKALDMRQRLTEDPSKAHLLPPDNASVAELHEWFKKMSQPQRLIPFPGEGGYGRESGVPHVVPPDETLRHVLGESLKQNGAEAERLISLSKEDRRLPEPPKESSDSTRPPWHKRSDLVLAGFLFCLAAVLSIALLILPPTQRTIIFWLAVMVCLLSIAWFLLARHFDFSRGKTRAGFLIPIVLVAAFGWYAWPPPKSEPQKAQPEKTQPTAIKSESPKTLHDYFAEEGGNCWRESIGQEIAVKGERIKAEAQMCMDFNSKAEHLAFYVPETDYAAEVCSRLINDHQATIQSFIERYQGRTEAGPMEGRKTEVRDLRFTKYVVIFYEAFIPQFKLDALELQAKEKGLIIELHSQEYVMRRSR